MADPTIPRLVFAPCETCRGSTTMVGVDCRVCNHHFHFGRQLLGSGSSKEPITCPRCDALETVRSIGGKPDEPITAMNEQAIIDAVCADVEAAVAKRVRRVSQSRRSTDPNFWANVMLRESWYVDNGDYVGWDRSALAGGIDPRQFGPA